LDNHIVGADHESKIVNFSKEWTIRRSTVDLGVSGHESNKFYQTN